MTHTVDHTADQPGTATRGVTGSAPRDDPALSPEQVSARLSSAVEAWLPGRDREAAAWMGM